MYTFLGNILNIWSAFSSFHESKKVIAIWNSCNCCFFFWIILNLIVRNDYKHLGWAESICAITYIYKYLIGIFCGSHTKININKFCTFLFPQFFILERYLIPNFSNAAQSLGANSGMLKIISEGLSVTGTNGKNAQFHNTIKKLFNKIPP